jgi:hypothetical protein
MSMNNQKPQKPSHLDAVQGTSEARDQTVGISTVRGANERGNAEMRQRGSVSVNWVGLYTMVRREVERTMRVKVQTLVSPVMSATLYIFIFGHVIGTKIDSIIGVPYITFVFPGILMLSVINAAFSSSSSSLILCSIHS